LRRFENLLILFIILVLAMGFWLLYYSYKVDYNYSITKMLVDRDRTNVEMVGVLLDELSRLEEKYERSATPEEHPMHKLKLLSRN